MEDLGIFHIVGQPNLNIKVDRVEAARYGLNTGDVNTVVQAAMAGAVATTVLESDRQFNLTVRLAQKYRDSIEKIGNVPVAYQTPARHDGLYSAARARHHQPWIRARPSSTTRPRNATFRSSSACAAAISAARWRRRRRESRRTCICPRGYRIVWAGEFQDLQTAKQRLAVFVPMSLALILILLYSLFNSVRDSLLALGRNTLCDRRRACSRCS